MGERDNMRRIFGFNPPTRYREAHKQDRCPADGAPCYVAVGTDEPHWRCGTAACFKDAAPSSLDQGGGDG